jgi:HK97 family phage major capsid protein
MIEEIKSLLHEQKKLIVDYQAKNEEMLKGKIGPAELKAFEDKIVARLDGVDKELVGLKRPASEVAGKLEAAEKKAAFESWLRRGEPIPAEKKVMIIGDDTLGGYLAVPEYVAEIIKTVNEFSPIRSLARIRSTSAKSVQFPTRSATFAASWVSEIGTRSEATGQVYGLEEIPTHELAALVKVSNQDLEDSAFNLEAELSADAGEKIGVAEGTAFVTGNKVGRPEGVVMNSSVVSATKTTASASAITGDEMKEVLYGLKETYARNSTWAWRRATTLYLSTIKELSSGSNQYLWRPGLMDADPATFLGRPYVECPDMAAIAASAKSVILGDFRRGYLIVDRLAVNVLRDPYTSKTTGTVEFLFRKRVGGQVVLSEAFQLLTQLA